MTILKNEKGSGYVSTAVCLFFATAIFALVLTFSEALGALRVIYESSKRALDSCVIDNATIIYDSIKQGHNRATSIEGTLFEERFIIETGGARESGNIVKTEKNGSVIWSVEDTEISFETENVLRLRADYTVKVPLRIGELLSFDIEIPITVKSRYVNILME